MVDLADGTIAARLEGERRLADRFRVELESRIFVDAGTDNTLSAWRRDSFLTLRLGFFFRDERTRGRRGGRRAKFAP